MKAPLTTMRLKGTISADRFQQREKAMLLSYASVLLVTIAPLLSDIGSSALFGLPFLSIWLSGCFFTYAVLNIFFYYFLFRHWRIEGESI